MTRNQLWLKKPGPPCELNEEAVEDFKQGRLFPNGETRRGMLRVNWAYFRFMWRRCRPYEYFTYGMLLAVVPALQVLSLLP